MSFRKRNAPLSSIPGRGPAAASSSTVSASTPRVERDNSRRPLAPPPAPIQPHAPGIRPSPVDGRPITSTGTQSVDALLAGHGGLALGHSLLIEENGTTDYAGALLRFYAAEGVVQGHTVHVVGVGEYWGRDLPGLVGAADKAEKEVDVGLQRRDEKDKMKIAWRYERLGAVDGGTGGARVPAVDREARLASGKTVAAFCHIFDLTKRLVLPSPHAISYIPLSSSNPRSSPLDSILSSLKASLSNTDPASIHRLLLPNLLSPALYPPSASLPTHLFPFLHSLRALLRQNQTRLTALISLPLILHPRSNGLTRWMELLSDGVVELIPFPHTIDAGSPLAASGATTTQEEKPQGIVRIHRLPILHERGGGGIGGAGVGDDLAFTLSRRRFVVKPFSLPPLEGDTEAQKGEAEGGKLKVDIDF